MENLTLLHQVIKETSADPKEGHTVVVFETRNGSGEEFRFEIAPGQKAPKKGLLEFLGVVSRANYWAYAVSAAPSIDARFTSDMLMDDSVHKFTLMVDVTYSVSEPRLLVVRRNDDPLKLLRDKAVGLIQREIASRAWDEVVNRFLRVEQDVVSMVLQPLREFALSCGIRVQRVSLSRQIPAEYNIGNVTGLRIETDDAEAEIMRRRAVHRRAMDLADAASEALTTALKGSTSGVQNPAELTQTIGSLAAAIEQLRNVAGGVVSGNGGAPGEFTPIAGAAALPQLTAGRQSGLGPVLHELMSKTEAMRCGAAERNRLRAALLQLVAELLPVDEPKQELVTAARERVLAAGAEVNLTAEHADFIDSFTRTTSLRQRLQ